MTPAIGNTYLEIQDNVSYYSGQIGTTFLYGGQMSPKGNILNLGVMTSTPINIEDDPPGLRQQAYDYLNLFRNVKTYSLNNDELYINCGNNNSLLFSRH
jgi:hypothetical protein